MKTFSFFARSAQRMGSVSWGRQWTWVISFSCLLVACATVGTSELRYHEPRPTASSPRDMVVKASLHRTWDLLIDRLRLSFFDIESVDKANRTIDVAFSTDRPEQYIDCGTIDRTFQYANESQSYTYPLASSSSFKVATTYGKVQKLLLIGHYDRNTSLETVTTLSVMPSKKHTRVGLDSHYLFTSRLSGEQHYLNAAGKVIKRYQVAELQSNIAFKTWEPGSAQWKGPQRTYQVHCYATGKLEQELVALFDGLNA